jgi:hypothetical protein
MSDEIKQDRSPKSATLPLEEAITFAKRFYDNAGKATISRDSAFKAMGYAGKSGASLGTLATLLQYGLVEKKENDVVALSELAIRIFHPIDGSGESAIREAALTPPVFKSIFDTHHKLSEPILVNHLIHQGFTPDRAKRVASVYKANCLFAKLDENASLEDKGSTEGTPNTAKPKVDPALPIPPKPPVNTTLEALANLSEFSISIGDGRLAKIPFPMSNDDFETFLATLNLWKKKLVTSTATDSGDPMP